MLITEVSENNFINLSIDWMKQMYDSMNSQLFNGCLGGCDFNIFTTGKGSNGNTLGWFKLKGTNLKYNKQSRRIYKYNPYGVYGYNDKIFINKDNFVSLCKPTIELNGNYKWTEKAALSTLVHEMCHYYCEMNGYVPKQGHGTEFRSIASYVSSKSKGIFTVERLAKAEQLGEMELDSAIAAKNQQRQENKKNKIKLVFIFKNNGEIRLVNAANETLVSTIIDTEKKTKKCEKIVTSTDNNLKAVVFSNGYRSACIKYRYWNVTYDDFIKNLEFYDIQTIYLTDNTPSPVKKTVETPKTNVIPIFHFKTAQGKTFLVRNVTKEELINLLKQSFPKWSDSVIERIINTESYYK